MNGVKICHDIVQWLQSGIKYESKNSLKLMESQYGVHFGPIIWKVMEQPIPMRAHSYCASNDSTSKPTCQQFEIVNEQNLQSNNYNIQDGMTENCYARPLHTTKAYDKFVQASMEPVPDPPQRRSVARPHPPAIINPFSRLTISKISLLCFYQMQRTFN